MDWALLYEALVGWARALTSPSGTDPDSGVQFERRDTRQFQEDVAGDVLLTAVRTTGQDFETHVYRAGPDDVVHTAEGPRELVFQFQVTSTDVEPDRTAEALLGRLRDRALRESSRAVLHAAGLSVARIDPLVPLAREDENGHTLSVATLDVTFNAYAHDVEGAESGSYIKQVVVTSELNGAPDEAEWDDEVIGG